MSTSREFTVLAAVVILGVSLFLSTKSTNVLQGMYKALNDNAEYQQNAAAAAANYAERLHQPSPTKNKDLNFVIFYADDWTWKTVGIINDAVKTPHIDGMAKRGMVFTHNCVTTSICWQSRATKVTGLYASVHQHLRIWDEKMFDETVMWRQTLYPQLFFAGYKVGFFGKWHAPMPDKYRAYTFDHFKDYWGEHWMDRGGVRRHVTDVNKEDAMEYLNLVHEQNQNRQEKQKFSMTVSFYATHAWDGKKYPDVYQPQNYSEPLYRNATIPVPKTATQEAWDMMPWFFTEDNEGRRRWRQRFDSPEHYQVTMRRMYRMASEVDDVVGDVIAKLKDMGVYENTVLIFTTDNGNFHGEHGLADKWYPHEESIRVPLIIQDPRMPDNVRGTFNDEYTLNIDLAPTILSAAGVPVPPHMQGRDIAELYLGDTKAAAKSWRKDFFYEWSQGRPEDAEGHGDVYFIPAVYALVARDYKYFYWPQTKYEQLYNVAIDPLEENDVINTTDPALLQTIKSRYALMKNLSQHGHRV